MSFLLHAEPTISFDKGEHASALANAIVDTIRELLLVTSTCASSRRAARFI
jgi:hypothetical protein